MVEHDAPFARDHGGQAIVEIGMVEHLPQQLFRVWVRSGHMVTDRRVGGFVQAIDPEMK